MNTEKPADFERLPARFKRYIASLESELYTLRRAQAQQQRTRVSIEPINLSSDKSRRVLYLPEDEAVRFQIGKTDDYPLEVRLCKRDGKRIEIRASIGRLRVYSNSSNEIEVDQEERW